MDIIIVSIAALIAAALTLFSGFGLGTLLLPVIVIFFPIEIAITITAIVHLANNVFKLVLLGKYANFPVVIRFGATAVICAFLGALILSWLSNAASAFEYSLFGRNVQLLPVKFVVGMLILSFVLLELWPKFSTLAIDKKFLPLGGAISGFFGGLSGHQGAFRSMFLLKAGLEKQAFIATGVVIAVLVDVSRMIIYGWDIQKQPDDFEWPLIAAATVAAFMGSYFGARILKKVTIRSVQISVSVLLMVVALGLMTGLV